MTGAAAHTISIRSGAAAVVAKVPEVTAAFWLVKILVTTLGETAGDALSMSAGLGYAVSSAIFAVAFLVMVGLQMRAPRFQPLLYWGAMIAVTTVGTTLADLANRSLGLGYPGGASLLLTAVLLALWVWHRATGDVRPGAVTTTRAEFFYWVTIMCSQTLGTALGDWTSDSLGIGYLGSAALFGALLLVVWLLWKFSHAAHAVLFWAAFVLTRPLGAVVGDLLDKPLDAGGLDLSRVGASATLLALVGLSLLLFRQRAARADGAIH